MTCSYPASASNGSVVCFLDGDSPPESESRGRLLLAAISARCGKKLTGTVTVNGPVDGLAPQLDATLAIVAFSASAAGAWAQCTNLGSWGEGPRSRGAS